MNLARKDQFLKRFFARFHANFCLYRFYAPKENDKSGSSSFGARPLAFAMMVQWVAKFFRYPLLGGWGVIVSLPYLDEESLEFSELFFYTIISFVSYKFFSVYTKLYCS